MQHALRPYATAGAAIVGASLIAVTPMTAPLSPLTKSIDMALTAGEASPLGDLMAPWIAQFNTASENASQLANNFFLAPGVGGQQWLSVQSQLWQDLLNDPSKAGTITDTMQEHWKTLATAFTLSNADSDVIDSVTKNTLAGDGGLIDHHGLLGLLPSFLPADIPADQVTPIVNFLASPASALLIGALGPGISPWVALGNSITDGDSFNTTMANMVGAYFNGATLNLDSVIPLIKDAGVLPESIDFSHLEFAFGGLLSPGLVSALPYAVYDGPNQTDPSFTVDAVGGSIFNSLGLTINGVPVVNTLELSGHAVGPIAAMEAWSQIIGNELGSGWNSGGKGATNVPVTPPGGQIHFPTVPTDYFDGHDGGSASAASLDSVLAGLLSGSGDTANVTDQLTDLFNSLPGGDALADVVNSMF